LRHGGGARAVKALARPAVKGPAHQNTSHVAVGDHRLFSWLHNMLNFQGIVAGITVLGLAGLAASAAKLPDLVALLIGVAASLVMMALVAGFFGVMVGMDDDCTVRLEDAVGTLGTVYLSIPARNEGQGKVTLNLQERLMEFPAVTFQEAPLSTGQKILVVAVQKPTVMEVVSAEKYLSDTQT